MGPLVRSGISVVAGVVFFWIPLWFHSYFTQLAPGADVEDPVGAILFFGVPIITVFAILATISLKRAYLSVPGSNRVGRLVLVFGLAAVCWSPAACFCFMAILHR